MGILAKQVQIQRRTLSSGEVLWLGVILSAFAVVYVVSLTFEYVEGDDASSIAFHALGRDRHLQPPYSAYHAMMDSLLGVLPADEKLLRFTAISLTSLAAPLMVGLVLALVFTWISEGTRSTKCLCALLVLLAVPELFYFGLVYTPSVIAMCALLTAHLLLRTSIPRNSLAEVKNPALIIKAFLALILFGVGAAARWDTVTYGAVMVADLVFYPSYRRSEWARSLKNRLLFPVLWGSLALVSWVVAIHEAGYGIEEFLTVIQSSGPVEKRAFLAHLTLVRFNTVLTPIFVVLSCCGITLLIRNRSRMLIVVTIGILIAAPFVSYGNPKWIITAMPALLYCFALGFFVIWQKFHRHGKASLVITLVAASAIPWMVGIHATYGDSAWGPGFEIRPFDRPFSNGLFASIVVGAGAAVPTPEGPRPVFGHGMVLLGGGWRKLIDGMATERRRAIQEALRLSVPLLQDRGQGLAVAELAGFGFTTTDAWNRRLGNNFIVERRFLATGAKSLRMLRLVDRGSLYRKEDLDELRRIIGAPKVVIYGYTSTLRGLYRLAPDSLWKLGPGSAILDLERLREGISRGVVRDTGEDQTLREDEV